MGYTDFEKKLYSDLFDLFQKEEHHVEFTRENYDGDFEELRNAVTNLADGGILIPLEFESDSVVVELQYDCCYDFKEL